MFLRNRIATLRLALVTVLAWSALATAESNSLFTTLSLNPVGSGPVAIASGDFNGDGFPDRAVVNSRSNSVSILLGTGDGNFQPAVNYTVGGFPTAIVAGDFNHDGHLDLAVANYGEVVGAGSVSILLGRGDGTFVGGATYPITFDPVAIVAGDLDGDGNLDLAVLISYPPTSGLYLNILRGGGDGSFKTGTNFLAGVSTGTGYLAVGDFTGNGRLDLVVFPASVSNTDTYIFFNDGSGNFPSENVCCTTGALSVVVADFNNDGKLDIAESNSNGLTIWLGNGDGTFSLASSPSAGNNPDGLAAGDLNGDGKVDLVAADYTDGTVSVLLGKGDGTFTTGATYPIGKQPVAIALADLNGDGKLDVTVANGADNSVQVLLGGGDGTFRSGTYRVPTGPFSITSGDFNRDGIPDLAVLNGDGTVTVFLGDGHGGFKVLNPFPGCGSGPGLFPLQIVAADMNGDGTSDLAIACNESEAGASFVALFQGNGDGSFSLKQSYDPDAAIRRMIAADVNGNGIPDLIVASPSYVSVTNLDGNDLGFPYNGYPITGVRAGDFNGDGKTDLLVVGLGVVLLGDGTGSFQTLSTGWIGGLTGDFNGDGLSDFINDPGYPPMQLISSNGDGTFVEAFVLPVDRFGNPKALADFNGDGVPDLLTTPQFGAPLNVFFGQDGTFVDSGISLPPFGEGDAVVADFDGNGSPDVAFLDFNAGTVSILLNKSSFKVTSTLLSELPAKVVVGEPVTFSAAVTSKQGTPTGSVTFKQAGVPQTTAPLSSGVAQATLSAPTSVGIYGFTALYTGDGTFSGSLSQRVLVTVSTASTTTTVTSNAPLSKLGQSVTFTATVHPQYSGQPTGTVQFYADGNPMGSASVSGGQAACNTSSLTLGAHTIQADYSGDSSFTTSLGSTKQKVGDAASSIQLTSSLNPAGYGQAVTLTATVTDSAGSVPTGVVVFSERGAYYGTVTLSGGVAQIALPTTLAAGKHTITAQYSGDLSNGPAKASLTQVITGASSTTTITSDTEPSTYGQTVTFTAVVSSTAGTPDGTVTFKNGSAVLGTVALSGGQAAYSVSTLNGGTHTIKAVYNGSSGYGPSSASIFQIVEPAATTTTLTSSLNPAPYGQIVTLTAVVTSVVSATPSGNVTIKDGKKVLGSASLVNGQMQISTSLLAEGGHTLTATYTGSANFSGSSGTVSQTMQ